MLRYSRLWIGRERVSPEIIMVKCLRRRDAFPWVTDQEFIQQISRLQSNAGIESISDGVQMGTKSRTSHMPL